MYVCNRACDAASSVNISQSGIFPARHKNWEILLRCCDHPTVGGINLVELLEPAFSQNLKEKFVGKSSLLVFGCVNPFIQYRVLDPAHGFFLRNARIGHSIQMTSQEFFLLLSSQFTIMRNPFVF